MAPLDNPVIPKGSLVFITGVSGYVGSHVADQFLSYGYRVIGTTRNPEKSAWLTEYLTTKYGPGKFDLVKLVDYTTPDALHALIENRDVAAVIHTATVTGKNSNPDEIIPQSINMTMAAVRAAAREPSVKRLVLTSSISAVYKFKPATVVKLDVNSWNDEAVEIASQPASDEENPFLKIYPASKVLSEREAWKFVEEEKPGFILNSVVPGLNFGPSLDPVNQGHQSSDGTLVALFYGDPEWIKRLGPELFVDVRDTARLHVAAAVLAGVESERIFAAAEACHGDQLLEILRKLYPNRRFVDNYGSERNYTEVLARPRAEQLLRDIGRNGWVGLEESVRETTQGLT